MLIKIFDPELNDIFTMLANDKTVIVNKKLAIKAGMYFKKKKIREKLVIGWDKRLNKSVIIPKPDVKVLREREHIFDIKIL